jgi:menaquinol-cytochrome c reductase iron-sulfur subunit
MSADVPDAPIPPRRRFVSQISVALSALAAVAAGVPVIGFFFAPASRRPPEPWHPVGKVDDFAIGETVEVHLTAPWPVPWAGQSAEVAAWLRRTSAAEFVAYSLNCTHLGCPVRWVASAELFLCPCHGGVYYSDGSVAGGPPPRALSQYPVRIEGTQVLIQPRALPT